MSSNKVTKQSHRQLKTRQVQKGGFPPALIPIAAAAVGSLVSGFMAHAGKKGAEKMLGKGKQDEPITENDIKKILSGGSYKIAGRQRGSGLKKK